MKRVVVAQKNVAQPSKVDQENRLQFDDPEFSANVIRWQKQHGRHALPWQNTRDPYRVWLSEIMLQQTQVVAVIPYYQRFLTRFPDLPSLASAPAEDVMSHWSGLGYYSRARNLHRCAQRVVAEYGGVFPSDPQLLAELPGIGRSTAAAIAAFSYGMRAAILDGNVKRVFARVFGVDGYPGEKKVEQALWQRAEALMPTRDVESYTQGLMDLGATLCTRNKPLCMVCPLKKRCIAFALDRVQELPMRKPKKAIPEKHTAMLIVLDKNKVLLRQRPDSGIWGGLLSLPEMDIGSDTVSFDIQDALFNAIAPFGTFNAFKPLPLITHGFTHFKLHISPYQIQLKRRLELAGQMEFVWYDIASLSQAPLPAPVKKLLLSCLPDAN
jgi:A/G-specific adenine glycosylase